MMMIATGEMPESTQHETPINQLRCEILFKRVGNVPFEAFYTQLGTQNCELWNRLRNFLLDLGVF